MEKSRQEERVRTYPLSHAQCSVRRARAEQGRADGLFLQHEASVVAWSMQVEKPVRGEITEIKRQKNKCSERKKTHIRLRHSIRPIPTQPSILFPPFPFSFFCGGPDPDHVRVDEGCYLHGEARAAVWGAGGVLGYGYHRLLGEK